MSDNPEEEKPANVDSKENENIDSDKSFESCVNESTLDGLTNFVAKDDDSDKSFVSCSLNVVNKVESLNLDSNPTTIEDTSKNVNDEDDDDDIRPGSCRENPSSDEETSSWDENNDPWIYDAEYLEQTEAGKELQKVDLTNAELEVIERDLEDIIENHVSKEVPERKPKKEREFKEKPNPTFIPVNGQFYMHDVRSEVVDPTLGTGTSKPTKKEKKASQKAVDSWSHDLYDEKQQMPISKTEIISKYGEDIRSRRGGREPNEVKLAKRGGKQSQSKRQNRWYQQENYYDYYDGYYDEYEGGYGDYGGDYGGMGGYYVGDYVGYGGDYGSYYGSYGYHEAGGGSQWTRRGKHDHEWHGSEIRAPLYTKKDETIHKKGQRPASKYGQIAELTDLKITVNLDNLGQPRQIKNTGLSSKKNYNSRTYENSNYRRSLPRDLPGRNEVQREATSRAEGLRDVPTINDCPTRNSGDREPRGWNNGQGQTSNKNNGPKEAPAKVTGPRESSNRNSIPKEGPTRNSGSKEPPSRYNGPREPPTRYSGPKEPPSRYNGPKEPPSRYNGSKEPPGRYNGPVQEPRGVTGSWERERNPTRGKKAVPDWVNTTFEWDPNSDFQDVIEEMPPLTENEINQLGKGRAQTGLYNAPPPPRFSRGDRHGGPGQPDQHNKQLQSQSLPRQTSGAFVPKRYSEFRNQSESVALKSTNEQQQQHHQQQQTPAERMMGYGPAQMLSSGLDYFGNLQPLLMPMNAHQAAVSSHSPQQQAGQSFTAMHPQIVSLLQSAGYAGPITASSDTLPHQHHSNHHQQHHQQQQQQQFYLQPLYMSAPTGPVSAPPLTLPPTVTGGRLNQFSPPFQPSYVVTSSPQSQHGRTVFPTASQPSTMEPTGLTVSPPNHAPNAAQSSRPVLGRS